MANKLFALDGFWDRIEEAIADSGMNKNQIAKKMGVERKALYANHSPSGSDRSWHSGRLAIFCKITGVSADWLLGLSRCKRTKLPKSDKLRFKVIDKRTGKEPIYDGNHLFKEKWFKESHLIYCDLDSWVVSEDGCLWLTDDCGNVGYPPAGRFEAIFE